MHPIFKAAQKALSLTRRLQKLGSNAKRTQDIVRDSRSFLRKKVPPSNVPFDIVAFGSIGRYEASAESDFDYLIIAYALPREVTQSRALISAIDELRKKLKLRPPGRTNTFGRVVAATDLTEFIGLEDDTNRSLTHRILMLGESVSLYQPDRHKLLIKRIIERYLSDYSEPKIGVPRFLLNDILRYWRTLAVDYQAKRWEQVNPDWGLRYLKLLISRKLAFTGYLVPLLLCERATVRYFVEQFSMPPLARVVQLYEKDPSFHRPLSTILEIADEFAIALSNANFRREAEKVKAPGDKSHWPPVFKRMADRAKTLQSCLEQIMFGPSELGNRARKYLSF